MQSFKDVIEKWPNISEFGNDIGVDDNHARTMKQRDSIPAKYWVRVVEGAQRRKIDGINHEVLAHLSSQEFLPEKSEGSEAPRLT